MNKITPFLWFNDNAEDAAEFYLSVFPEAKKVGELRSSGVGPWPAGKIATIAIELMGQQMTFLNGGPAQALTPAFSYSVACKDQAEINRYWDIHSTKSLRGGWIVLAMWILPRADASITVRSPRTGGEKAAAMTCLRSMALSPDPCSICSQTSLIS